MQYFVSSIGLLKTQSLGR